MYYRTTYESPAGMLTLAENGDSLVGLWIDGQKYFPGTVEEEMQPRDDRKIFDDTKRWLDRYFAGKRPEISELPLAPSGSEFRRHVWRLLCEIPYGEVTTYGEIAKKMAVQRNRTTMSAQAVGGAVGHNPISIIIPCHRVIGTDGSLTGYAGGLELKRKLLELEGVDVSCLR